MGGGLIELVAHGVQDIYLIGNPQISFFKVIYKRHTNFSMESIRGVFDGDINFGNKVSISLPRNGDLIHTMTLEVDLPLITSKTPLKASSSVTVIATEDEVVGAGKTLNITGLDIDLANDVEILFTNGGVLKITTPATAGATSLTGTISNATISSGEVGSTNINAGGGNISYVNSIGHALIDYVELEIGGQAIDRHYGEWMEIWSLLTTSKSKQFGYTDMIQRYSADSALGSFLPGKIPGPLTTFTPLQFWFCRNVGLALPLVALQYHEVKVNLQFKPLSELTTFGQFKYFTVSAYNNGSGVLEKASSTDPDFESSDVGKYVVLTDGSTSEISTFTNQNKITIAAGLTAKISVDDEIYIKPNDSLSGTPRITEARLYADYIFLDTYERKKFAQMNHRYLIEQVQYNEKESFPSGTTDRKFKLDFNLPVKSIYWVVQLDKTSRDNDLFNFSDTVNYNVTKGDPITKAVLKMNGSDRFDEREAKYFRLIQPFQKHTTVPNDFIYMYSFALKPENYQPSGACNFSKIDNANLTVTFKSGLANGNIKVFALNYNILRIFSGMGGLAFSN